MHSRLISALVISFLGLTAAPQPAESEPISLMDSEVHRLTSDLIEQDYRLFVALPRGYGETEQRFPVLYVLDADIFIGTITETVRLLPLERVFTTRQVVPDVIVVGIAYPGGFDEMARKRGRDFTPTAEFKAGSAAKDELDGAARFFRFLERQAIPFIDKTYRTKPRDRTLIGSSAGGLFVLDTLLRHPGTFRRYVATSPRMDDIIFRHEAAYAGKHQDLPAVLYLSAGTEGEIEQQIAAGVERFHATLAARRYPGLHLVYESLDGENHVSAQPTAFTHGLKAAFAAPLADR